LSHDDTTIELRWVRWRVTGRVQRVGFRWFVQQAAIRQYLVGDVCNLADGSVEIRVRGTKQELERLLAEVRRGPDGARVDDVEMLHPESAESVATFAIRHPDKR